jgi:hypothetical protein
MFFLSTEVIQVTYGYRPGSPVISATWEANIFLLVLVSAHINYKNPLFVGDDRILFGSIKMVVGYKDYRQALVQWDPYPSNIVALFYSSSFASIAKMGIIFQLDGLIIIHDNH